MNRLILILLASLSCSPLFAAVKLPAIIGSHMALQSGKPVPVWGDAGPGEKVEVAFAGQVKRTVAGENGEWMIILDPLTASKTSQKMTISGKNTITLEDIVVGEVWLCSGQSNMARSLGKNIKKSKLKPKTDDQLIRVFLVAQAKKRIEQKDVEGQWKVGSPESLLPFSSIGYYFGTQLRKELKVPIGLIGSASGGSSIEQWISPEGFKMIPGFKSYTRFIKERATTNTTRGFGYPAERYNGMIHPLEPFSIRGVIWYQGEANSNAADITYQKKMKALIEGWRTVWHNAILACGITTVNRDPFYFAYAQLSKRGSPNNKPAGGNGWVRVWDAQRKSLKIPYTGMAVIADLGPGSDLHPINKRDAGNRLALWPLAKLYGKKIVYSGPLYKSHTIEGDVIRLTFTHTGTGLMVGSKKGFDPVVEVKNGKLARFAVADETKKWFWADAVIDGTDVLVSCKEVPKPVAVRYAWSQNPEGMNLYNKEGLPASPFRTDTW